jgi:sec-independent protein translocase protein TatA
MFPGNLGPGELMVIMVIGVLLFGKRLPEVGRSLGKGIVEFKKGLRGEDEPDPHHATSLAHTTPATPPVADYQVPKFEPPTQPPVVEANTNA